MLLPQRWIFVSLMRRFHQPSSIYIVEPLTMDRKHCTGYRDDTAQANLQLKAAVLIEREACAQICEARGKDYLHEPYPGQGRDAAEARTCAAAIRARGSTITGRSDVMAEITTTYLSDAELTELTARSTAGGQIKWLEHQGWPYVRRADGKPRVLRAYHDAKLMGREPDATAATAERCQPKWTVPLPGELPDEH